jgi:hypothetical protein
MCRSHGASFHDHDLVLPLPVRRSQVNFACPDYQDVKSHGWRFSALTLIARELHPANVGAPQTKSSWACSCAIRVNWTRNSRSAMQSRWLTAHSDSPPPVPPRTRREADCDDSERNSFRGMTNVSDPRERMPEVRMHAVLKGHRAPTLSRVASLKKGTPSSSSGNERPASRRDLPRFANVDPSHARMSCPVGDHTYGHHRAQSDRPDHEETHAPVRRIPVGERNWSRWIG